MPATYRYEMSKSGRAGCQNSACKHDSIKIGKGELRFGVLCTFEDRDFWKWKHWGCVTPLQIANVQKDIEGLDLDDEEDMNVLDGYEELPDEAKEKIRQALKDGHVADEDWKGDLDKNRPGQKGINSARRKKKTVDEENPDEDRPTDETPVKPKKKRMTKKEKDAAAAAAEEDAEDEVGDREETPVPVKKKSGRKVKDEEPEESAAEVIPAKKKRASPKKRNAEADEVGIKSKDEQIVPETLKKRGRVKKQAMKKEEEVDEVAKTEEDPVQAPQKRARVKKVKKEEPNADEEMLDIPDRTAGKKEAGLVKNEEPADDMPMADVPEAKKGRTARATKTARARKVKAEQEAEEDEDEMAPARPVRKPRAKKVKEEVKEEPLDDQDEHIDKPAYQPGAVKLEEPLAKLEHSDELIGPTQNDDAEPAEEEIAEPKAKKGRKHAKRTAR